MRFSTEIKLFGISVEEKNSLKMNSKAFELINNILALAKFCINKSKAQNLNPKLCFINEWEFRKEIITQRMEEQTKRQNNDE